MSKTESVDLSAPLAEFSGMSESLGEILAAQEDSDRFFADVLGKIDAILTEFAREQQRWQQECDERERALAAQAKSIEEQREELQSLRGALVAEVGRVQADASVRETGSKPDVQVEAMRQATDEARREQLAIETELESVRARAAELTESLETQKHEAAEQRTQWVDELRRQRLLLESLVHSLADRPVAPAQASAMEAALPRDVQAADSALESVMAQFEMLQRDVARRRGKAESGTT